MGEIVEILITGMSHDGRGVGRIADFSDCHGMTVFVDKAIVGQKVCAEITARKKNFFEAVVCQVLEQSVFFTPSYCPHHPECGGCAWQNISYEKQLQEKENFVRSALQRLGGIKKDDLNFCFFPILSCLDAEQKNLYFYRNKMEFAFDLQSDNLDRKTLKLGLRKRNSHDIAEVTECRLMPEKAMTILNILRDTLKNFSFLFYRFAVLRCFQNNWTVELITYPSSKKNQQAEEQSVESCYFALKSEILGLVHSERKSKSDIAYGEKVLREFGTTALSEILCFHDYSVQYKLGSSAFFQVNTSMTEVLYAVVQDFAKLVLPFQNAQIWDFYCGVGSIGLSLAPICTENNKKNYFSRFDNIQIKKSRYSYKKPFLLGAESVEKAIMLARENAQLNTCDFSVFEITSAKNLHKYFKRFSMPHLIVLDPPRAGIDDEAIQAILQYKPEHLILVSCNAATLSRDLGKLAVEYRILAIQSVDLFPHTPHVETVVLLAKK